MPFVKDVAAPLLKAAVSPLKYCGAWVGATFAGVVGMVYKDYGAPGAKGSIPQIIKNATGTGSESPPTAPSSPTDFMQYLPYLLAGAGILSTVGGGFSLPATLVGGLLLAGGVAAGVVAMNAKEQKKESDVAAAAGNTPKKEATESGNTTTTSVEVPKNIPDKEPVQGGSQNRGGAVQRPAGYVGL